VAQLLRLMIEDAVAKARPADVGAIHA
jgi:hypothetical protein